MNRKELLTRFIQEVWNEGNEELFADSNAVVATWFWTATHTGAMEGFPPSGRTLRMSGATVYDFEDDRTISAEWTVAG
jgi:predicted ester cyclase